MQFDANVVDKHNKVNHQLVEEQLDKTEEELLEEEEQEEEDKEEEEEGPHEELERTLSHAWAEGGSLKKKWTQTII